MGRRARTLKIIRGIGVALMVIGFLVGLGIFTTEPLSPAFLRYFAIGTGIFMLGSLLYMGYEVFVPEFWRGEWAPGPGHEYPPDP